MRQILLKFRSLAGGKPRTRNSYTLYNNRTEAYHRNYEIYQTSHTATSPLSTFLSSRHMSTALSTEKSPSLSIGEEYYQRAKQHLTNHEENKKDQEETNRAQQYKKPGIAVVKTIAKQTRQQTKTKLRKGKAKKANVEESASEPGLSEWDKAQKCMQIAAFVHGYQNAIVSLANHALSSSTKNFDADKEYKHVLSYISSQNSDAGGDGDSDGDGSDSDGKKNAIATIVPIQDFKGKGGAAIAKILYENAGRLGSPEGWFNLGHMLWTGHDPDVQVDVGRALECFEKAVDLGDDDARYFLSVYYLGQEDNHDAGADGNTNDDGLYDTSRKRGLQLLQESCNNGHVGALYYLALMYRNGDAGLDFEQCMDLYREYLDQAADGGDADALFLRAYCMCNGEDGYEMNKVKGLEGFVESGEAGNADGFVSAGALCHHGGIEIKRDQRRAFELYQQAGELGSVEGWKNVVACYALGEGVPKCEQTAKHISKTMLSDQDR